jgi:tetratricopeptide (TPR) repeat protein
MAVSVAAAEPDPERLQELLYGEALFHAHQQDYLSAITHLQRLEDQGLVSPSSADLRLLLARMKLVYGLHLEAGFDFHAALGEDVPEGVRNRAWYELARTYARKGYFQAALEVLEHVEGEVPQDIVGDYQLLNARVLMALDQNRQAAQLLADWRGAPALAAYAHYNRGIALIRTNDYAEAVSALNRAVKLRAEGEERLALRDKARLSLGYLFARTEDYDQARKQLERVRLDGPFSNRALLALGWIAHKQGRRESALVSWTELRGRSPTDPAVLESLLVIPAVHRELEALQAAGRDYEQAIKAYTSELDRLQHARQSVRDGDTVSLLLRDGRDVIPGPGGKAAPLETRYLGPLLASRDFQQLLHGHGELQTMLQQLDEGLEQIEGLARTGTGPGQGRAGPGDSRSPPTAAGPSRPTTAGRAAQGPARGRAGSGDDPDWQPQWGYREGELVEEPAPGIPPLPEVESPADRVLKPLPETEFIGLPESDFSGLPPAPEFTAALPDSEVIGLPESEIRWLPETGRFRMPGTEEEDYAYPDGKPRKRSRRSEGYAYPLNRLIPSPDDDVVFDPGPVPVGEALRDLASALSRATDRMAGLGAALDPAAEIEGFADRLAALRGRILQLRARIENALALYEGYTRALALEELDRRQHLLEDLLKQASLELAKTYDQASDP